MCGFTRLVGMTERQEPQEQAGSAGEEGALICRPRGGSGDTSKRGCSSVVCVGLGMRSRRRVGIW